jgi:saccharopine dehydrogenase-like NADP-dependent oxidoreductase
VNFVAQALGCPALADVAALLNVGLDAVSIAAPTHLNREIALACIARGINVLVESRSPRARRRGAASLAIWREAPQWISKVFPDRVQPPIELSSSAREN